MCLHADYVLVSLKNPDTGIPMLMDLLKQYGNLSGYTLHIEKTQVLVFNFIPPLELNVKYTFNWNSSTMKYLGVRLTKEVSGLYAENYQPINARIREDLDRWASLTLDLGNRIMVIKNNILPRLLYLFQSLPVEIPDFQFREWDKAISRFIWNSKAPRIRFKSLQLPRSGGGMSLPCLRDYYIAVQIRPLMLWCNNDYIAKWRTIELSLSSKPLQSILSNPLQVRQCNIQNQWVRFSLNIWSDLVKQLKLKETCCLMWPVHDSTFEPAVMDKSFIQWEKRGVMTLCLLMDNLNFIDFKTMSEKIDLDRCDFYKYLQLRHYFDKNIKSLQLYHLSGITEMFIKAYNSKLHKKIIGELYWNIIKLRNYSTFYIKEKWERELGVEITPNDWESIIDTQITTTNSQMWRDFSWKNIVRYFITPKIKSRQTGQPAVCWRECGHCPADHTHDFGGVLCLTLFGKVSKE